MPDLSETPESQQTIDLALDHSFHHQLESPDQRFLLPRIRKSISPHRRKSSVYFSSSIDPKLIPIMSRDGVPTIPNTHEALNFHRRASNKLNKYINNRSEMSRLNRIPLRRFSLNVPLSTELENTLLHRLSPKRKKSLDSKMPTVPIMQVDESTLKFGAMLSSSAQCALLKAYEDEIHSRMRVFIPYKRLPRVTTAKFVANVKPRRRNIFDRQDYWHDQHHQDRSNSTSRSSTSLVSVTENNNEINKNLPHRNPKKKQLNYSKASIRLLKDYQSIDEFSKRIKIADHLQRAMNLIAMLENCQDSYDVEDVARKYERWQLKWSKILEECF